MVETFNIWSCCLKAFLEWAVGLGIQQARRLTILPIPQCCRRRSAQLWPSISLPFSRRQTPYAASFWVTFELSASLSLSYYRGFSKLESTSTKGKKLPPRRLSRPCLEWTFTKGWGTLLLHVKGDFYSMIMRLTWHIYLFSFPSRRPSLTSTFSTPGLLYYWYLIKPEKK